MLEVRAVPALRDNYIWVLRRRGQPEAAVVDPGEAAPVEGYLEREGLKLSAILITHHHWDHTGGIESLVEQHGAPVYAPAHERSPIARVTHPMENGDRVHLEALALSLEVIGIPGHTLGHVAYYGEDSVFCGDTLFCAGCGKVFEGTAAQMHESLSRLAGLPEQTRVYCGHEYTCKNLAFALAVEPDNQDVKDRLSDAMAARERGEPTLPSRMGDELRINPFLRCKQASVAKAAAAHAGKDLNDPVDVFGAVRAWKDNFSPPRTTP